jgi:hypothetical protein
VEGEGATVGGISGLKEEGIIKKPTQSKRGLTLRVSHLPNNERIETPKSANTDEMSYRQKNP